MENRDFMLFCLAAILILLPILAGIIRYFAGYMGDIRYVKGKIEQVYDWDEYVYWRKELRILHLCVLPFVTPDKVKRLRRHYWCKRHWKKEENDGFFSMLAPSLAGILVCCVCLVAGTMAWFNASVSSPMQTMQSAEFSVKVTVEKKDAAGDSAQVLDENTSDGAGRQTTLEAGSYLVTLEGTGTASTGYCRIVIGEKEYYSAQINRGKDANGNLTDENGTLEFMVTVGESTSMMITPIWGTYAHNSDEGESKVVAQNGEINLVSLAEASTVQASAPSSVDTSATANQSSETSTEGNSGSEGQQTDQTGGTTDQQTDQAGGTTGQQTDQTGGTIDQ